MKDAYYFPHDSNATGDPKIMRLMDDLGPEGYGIFWIIVEHLREQPGYKSKTGILRSLAKRNMSASDNLEDAEKKFLSVVNKYDLFTIEDETFFSESLIRRMQRYDERKENLREAGRKGGLSKAKTMPERGSSNAKASVKQPSTTRVKESKVKESKEEKKNLNADYVAIVSLLMSEIEKNDSKHFQGKDRDSISRQWYDPIRLLIEKDGREPDLVRSVITWSQGSDFWKSNILSTKKLREKFSQLLLQMNNVKNNPPDEEELFATEPKFTPKDIPLQWKRN